MGQGAGAAAVLALLITALAGCTSTPQASGPAGSQVPSSSQPSQPSADEPVTVSYPARDEGAFGLDMGLLYRSAGNETIVRATLLAGGIEGRTELYQRGVDDDGPPQQPTLAPAEVLAVSVFTVPDCAAPAIGQDPRLRVTFASPHGGTSDRTYRIDALAPELGTAAKAWCAHDVMLHASTFTGYPGCDATSVTLLARNPSLSAATLTIDGATYAAQPLHITGGGSAQWTITSSGRCPAHTDVTASVRYSDGRAAQVSLDLDRG